MSKRMMGVFAVLVLVMGLAAPSVVGGTVYGWDDEAGDDLWSSASNWKDSTNSNAAAPGSGDIVRFNDPADEGTVIVDGDYEIAELQMGLLTFSGGETLAVALQKNGSARTVAITDAVRIGQGSVTGSTGHVTNTVSTDGIDLVVGSVGSRAVVEMGYNTANTNNKRIYATLDVDNGSFTAYLSHLQLGHKENWGGSNGEGNLDLTTSTALIDISGNAYLGYTPGTYGAYAKGRIWVENGTVSVGGDLRLAKYVPSGNTQNQKSNNGTRGEIYVTNTPFSVAGDVYFSGNVNDGESWSKAYAFVHTTVDGKCSGLDLGAASTWLWTSNDPAYNKIDITFASDPVQTDPDGYYWGLRWAGDHTSDLQTRINNAQLVWDVSGLSPANQALVGMIYDADTGYTYVGFEPQVFPVAEPGGLGLLGLALVGLRKRRS